MVSDGDDDLMRMAMASTTRSQPAQMVLRRRPILPPRKRLYRWLSQVFARWAETAEDE